MGAVHNAAACGALLRTVRCTCWCEGQYEERGKFVCIARWRVVCAGSFDDPRGLWCSALSQEHCSACSAWACVVLRPLRGLSWRMVRYLRQCRCIFPVNMRKCGVGHIQESVLTPPLWVWSSQLGRNATRPLSLSRGAAVHWSLRATMGGGDGGLRVGHVGHCWAQSLNGGCRSLSALVALSGAPHWHCIADSAHCRLSAPRFLKAQSIQGMSRVRVCTASLKCTGPQCCCQGASG
jgi:hypothetical protein